MDLSPNGVILSPVHNELSSDFVEEMFTKPQFNNWIEIAVFGVNQQVSEEYIMEQVRHAADTGEPIVRTMEYEFPDQGFNRRMPQYMLGPEYLVAPVTNEDDSAIL